MIVISIKEWDVIIEKTCRLAEVGVCAAAVSENFNYEVWAVVFQSVYPPSVSVIVYPAFSDIRIKFL